MEKRIKNMDENMEMSKNSLCLIYQFYFKLLDVFIKSILGKHEGTFHLAYSQKIEDRRLGMVAGIQGTLKWTNGKEGIQKQKLFSFLLLEHESTEDFTDIDSPPMAFSLNRMVKIHLMPKTGEMTEEMFSILEEVDKAFSQSLADVHFKRRLACKKCQENRRTGWFPVEQGTHLVSDTEMCSLHLHHPEVQFNTTGNQVSRSVFR